MTTYIKVSVPKPGLQKGRGLNVKDKIILYDMEDVLKFPSREAGGVVISDNVIFKSDAYCISLYGTPDTFELTSNTEGDLDNEGFIPGVKFKHPGNELEIREFKTNWLGRNIGIFVLRCGEDLIDLYGSPCTPMRMQAAYTGNKDANGTEFTFTQSQKGNDVAIYKGTITLEAPLAVVPAGATTIDLVGSGTYQLSGHTEAVVITEATGATHGMRFTLLGVTSGTAPTLAGNAKFILKDGASWTASVGAQISFTAFKSGTDFVYIEQSRT